MKKIAFAAVLMMLAPFCASASAVPKDGVFNVVVIPGHDNESWGTEFRGMKEADMNVVLAKKLMVFLELDPLFEPVLARDEEGYLDPFLSYFEKEKDAIAAFQKKNREAMEQAVASGAITRVDGINHNTASSSVALKLHGINKWSNEHDVEFILHIHFNDYRRKVLRQPGEYRGFSIYAPEAQFKNSASSLAIAQPIFARLESVFDPSNLPLESEGIIETQGLIAIGSNNSLAAPSILVEYGYVYEPQFQQEAVRDAAFTELAWQTYLGIRDAFFRPEGDDGLPDTALLPYEFTKTLRRGAAYEPEVLALQMILLKEDLYYKTEGGTRVRCAVDGMFGPCTEAALKALQRSAGIGEQGYVGSRTRAFLNGYGVSPAPEEEPGAEPSVSLRGFSGLLSLWR